MAVVYTPPMLENLRRTALYRNIFLNQQFNDLVRKKLGAKDDDAATSAVEKALTNHEFKKLLTDNNAALQKVFKGAKVPDSAVIQSLIALKDVQTDVKIKEYLQHE